MTDRTYTIGGIYPPDHKPNTFELEILTYGGDADGYDTVVLTFERFPTDENPDTDYAALNKAIDILELCDAIGGRFGGSEYRYSNTVPGWQELFGAFYGGDRNYWKRDEYGDTEYSYDSYKLFFYDADLVKHYVVVGIPNS